MSGFITERDFEAAEREFPGIQGLYDGLVQKPATFLDLVWKYQRMIDKAAGSSRPTSSHPASPSA